MHSELIMENTLEPRDPVICMPIATNPMKTQNITFTLSIGNLFVFVYLPIKIVNLIIEIKMFFSFIFKRPILVLKCEQGYVGYKAAASPRLECNKATYETIQVERDDKGIVHFKGTCFTFPLILLPVFCISN